MDDIVTEVRCCRKVPIAPLYVLYVRCFGWVLINFAWERKFDLYLCEYFRVKLHWARVEHYQGLRRIHLSELLKLLWFYIRSVKER